MIFKCARCKSTLIDITEYEYVHPSKLENLKRNERLYSCFNPMCECAVIVDDSQEETL